MVSIKSIQFFNHHIFENHIFDFTIDGINPVNNIIIAGENGSGKTKLLEELYNISNTSFFINSVIYSQKTLELTVDVSDDNYYNFDNDQEKIDKAILIISKNGNGDISNKVKFVKNDDSEIRNVKRQGTRDKLNIFKLNGLYSNVDINYKPRNNVQGTTNKTLDNQTSEIPNDMAHEIIQLLVDIAMQDSCDVDTWVGSHRNDIVPDNIYHTRLNRFTNAFKIIFDNTIQYKEIKNNSIPIFRKNNHDIEISSLSSGEKQIIFRGVFLLQNKNSLKGVPVFIDEPEISMHPKWEEKIFEYYKSIFSENSNQTSQMFIATHSEHILSNVLTNDDCLVIKIKNGSYEKFYKGSPGIVLPTITIAEIKHAIFDLYTTDFHNLLYGYIQENYVSDNNGNILNNANVKQTDEWLKNQGATPKHYYKQISVTNIKEYDTLPTYIRNCIDHPDNNINYTISELSNSIKELIRIINDNR